MNQPAQAPATAHLNADQQRISVFSIPSRGLDAATLTPLTLLLDATEQQRLASFKHDETRLQFLVGHALLRHALSRTVRPRHPPSAWQFTQTPSGRPILATPHNNTGAQFSLSHTRSLIVCSVTHGCDIGIDVEFIHDRRHLDALATRVLTRNEQATLQAARPEHRLPTFYQFWTLKEAVLKAAGVGLTIAPARLEFSLKHGQEPELLQIPAQLGQPADWTFRCFQPTPSHACALALRLPPTSRVQIAWQEWQHTDLLMRTTKRKTTTCHA